MMQNFSVVIRDNDCIRSRIEYLTIATPDFRFSLDLFPNVKFVIISSSLPIYYDQLTPILESEQMKKLNSFKIKSQICDRSCGSEVLIFFQKIFSKENSLDTFESLSQACHSFTNVYNLKMSVNLPSLTLKVWNLKFLSYLLKYTPNLKHLNFLVFFIGSDYEYVSNVDLFPIKLKTLCVKIENDSNYQELLLALFIKKFSSSLNYLSLDFNRIAVCESLYNGFTLQQQFLESMIQLKSFHLYTKLLKQPRDMKSFLSTFETQFWFDHHWIFGMHGTYMYTLPFHFDRLKDFIDFDEIKSSNSEILNSLRTWSHVKSIDFSNNFKFNSNVIEQLKLKMPNLTSTTVHFQLMYNFYRNKDPINQTNISVNSITTVYCEWKYLEALKCFLIHVFPNARRLMVSYSSASVASSSVQEYDDYFRNKWITPDYICSSKIEYVEMKIVLAGMNPSDPCVIHLARQLLEMFKNLQSFIFYIYYSHRYSSRILSITPSKETIQLLNMEMFAETYQIKHSYNYLQFIRKNNE